MPENKTEKKEKFTSSDIIKLVSHFIMCAAILVGSFVIRGNSNRITELEKRIEVIDVVAESIGVIKSTIKVIEDDTYDTEAIIKLREELDELTKRFNDSKIPIKKSKTKKKKR